MSESHLLDNAHLATDGTILSEKFKRVKQEIEAKKEP